MNLLGLPVLYQCIQDRTGNVEPFPEPGNVSTVGIIASRSGEENGEVDTVDTANREDLDNDAVADVHGPGAYIFQDAADDVLADRNDGNILALLAFDGDGEIYYGDNVVGLKLLQYRSIGRHAYGSGSVRF